MPLFEGRGARSAGAAVAAALVAHMMMRLIPPSLQLFNMMQTAVAILALASLSVLVVTHHRQHGEFLTRAQEEAILIAAFGLTWFAILIAFRAMTQRAEPGSVDLAGATREGRASRQAEYTTRRRPNPCRSDSTYCVVEEWTYW